MTIPSLEGRVTRLEWMSERMVCRADLERAKWQILLAVIVVSGLTMAALRLLL